MRRFFACSSLFAALALAACTNPPLAPAAPAASTPTSTEASGTSTIPYVQVPGVPLPPWVAPTDVAARIKAASLDQLTQEGAFEHIHQHVDVFYNGQPVTVPALIGIDPNGAFISPLHTHDDSGMLHIESPVSANITLGQFFTEWNVSLTGATAYVAGKPVSDASAVVLQDHMEIAVVYGTAPAQIPSRFAGTWPDGTTSAMPSVGP